MQFLQLPEPPPGAQKSKIKNRKSPTPFALLPPYQQHWVRDDSLLKIGVWSRQTGKSFSTAAEAVIDCLADPGTTWICLSAGERQSLEWLQKAKLWAGSLRLTLHSELQLRDSSEALLKYAEIHFANRSRILALPANPATARGYSGNVVLDEFAYHENPGAIWDALYAARTNSLSGTFPDRVEALFLGEDFTTIQRPLKLRVVSTFNGRNNKFFYLWERYQEIGFSRHFVNIHQAAAEAPPYGFKLNVEKLRAGLDDPEAWAQEYECIPADVSAVLLPYELLATCESPEATTTVPLDYFTSPATRHSSPYVIGIDFGRKHDLTVAWTDEIMGDVLHCREVLELREMPTPEQVDLLRPRIRNARRVCLDYNGNGVGLGDYLVKEFGQYNPDKHQFGKIELCHITNPLKVEIFSKLRMAFEQHRCRIPINRAVREDLHSVQRVTTQNGQITYRAPHTPDGHADRCTAKALAQRAAGCSTAPVAWARVETDGLMRESELRRSLGLGEVRPIRGILL